MAGFVSKKSAARWNNAARIIENNGAGSRHVKGLYRESRRVCEGVPPIGNHRGIAGATIAAGAVGAVVHDGAVYQVKNHSQCLVRIGDLVGLHVSPSCEAFFVPCVCGCDPPPQDCCDRSIAVCVNGDVRIIAVDAGQERWTFGVGGRSPFCCEGTCGPGSYFELSLQCTGTTVEGAWSFVCYDGTVGIGNPITTSGTIDLSALCSGTTEIEDTLTIAGHDGDCDLIVVAATEATTELCVPCGTEPPPPSCCDGSRWFCVNGQSVQIPLDNGSHVFDVASCCGCPGATLTLRLTCDPETGVVTMQHEYQCDLLVEIAAVNISSVCTSNDPLSIDISGSCFLTVLITITDSGCDPC